MIISASKLIAKRGRGNLLSRCLSSSCSALSGEPQYHRGLGALFNPTEEHEALRSMLRTFVEREVSGLFFFDCVWIQCSFAC